MIKRGPGPCSGVNGTGLGLSVVHGIVTAHRGAISVESTPGRGARFDVVFPAADDEQQAAHERAA